MPFSCITSTDLKMKFYVIYGGIVTAVFIAALLTCLFLVVIISPQRINRGVGETIQELPDDLSKSLERLKFINAITGGTLRDFRLIGITIGGYGDNGGSL